MDNAPQTASGLALANQRGTVSVTAILLVLALVGMAAMTIDIGHALLTQNQVQNASDASALAAGGALGNIYLNLPRNQQQNLTRNLTGNEEAAIEAMATNTALANGASDLTSLALANNSVVLGVWNWPGGGFTPTTTRPNAVQVAVSRNGQSNGPIATFFGGIFGVTTMNVNTVSTAALGVINGNLPPNIAEPPFALSSKWPQQTGCGGFISMRPNQQVPSCAGWHNFEEADHNPTAIDRTITDLINGNFVAPGIIPNQTTYNFNGGTTTPTYDDFKRLFDDRKDPNTGHWETTVPVFQDTSNGAQCDNPNGMTIIEGFANVKITHVSGAPNHQLIAEVQCDTFTQGKPSGPQPPPNGGGVGNPIAPNPVLVQ